MKGMELLAGVALAAGLWGCAARRAPESYANGASPVSLSREHEEEGGRPDDWEERQVWLARRGLEFTGDGVRIDEALARDLEYEPGPAASRERVSRSAEFLSHNAVIRAIGAARDAVLADRTNASAYAALGRALIAEREDDLALDAYKTASRLDPGSAPIRAALGDAFNRNGERESARSSYQQAVGLDPTDAKSFGRLAVLDYYLGDDLAAWRHAREAERLGGGVPPQFLVLLRERTPEPGATKP
ncbi:MAG: hypothetical protein R3B57_11965 [Phycisphaerales bacterium]